MKNRLIIAILTSILFSSLLHAQTVVQAPWSNCNIPDNIERWLNKAMNEAKNAVKNGRWYNNENHKFKPCKIQEIENLYKNLIFEYDCNCGDCALGGKNHHLKHKPFIRICQPLFPQQNNKNTHRTQESRSLKLELLIIAAGDCFKMDFLIN